MDRVAKFVADPADQLHPEVGLCLGGGGELVDAGLRREPLGHVARGHDEPLDRRVVAEVDRTELEMHPAAARVAHPDRAGGGTPRAVRRRLREADDELEVVRMDHLEERVVLPVGRVVAEQGAFDPGGDPDATVLAHEQHGVRHVGQHRPQLGLDARRVVPLGELADRRVRHRPVSPCGSRRGERS